MLFVNGVEVAIAEHVEVFIACMLFEVCAMFNGSQKAFVVELVV